MSAICYSDYSFITNCEDRIKTANRCNACAANVILESEQYCFYDSAYANDNKWTDLYKKTLERYHPCYRKPYKNSYNKKSWDCYN